MPQTDKSAKDATGKDAPKYATRDLAQEEAERLRQNIRQELDGAYGDFRRVEQRLGELPGLLRGVRERGWGFMPQMEVELSRLQAQWEQVRPRVVDEFDRFTRNRELDTVINFVIDVGFGGYERLGLYQLRNAENRARELRLSVQALLSPVDGPLGLLAFRVERIQKMLTELGGATFQLGKGEQVGWMEENEVIWGGEDRKCMIFFTSQRVILEERGGGILKKRPRKTIYAYPLADLDALEADRGFLGIGDKVNMKFAGGDTVTVKVGSPDEWLARVEPLRKPGFYGQVYSGGAPPPHPRRASYGPSAPEPAEAKRLRELLDKLDEQLAMGKVSEETYRELRAKYERELSRLVR